MTESIAPSPSQDQRQLIERGYGMFIHFGVNTFNELEWSDGTLPVSSFNPTRLDCDQWIRVAKEAGFRHVILITKHHDGFCLWPTKHTRYSVSAAPVTTDIVDEVAKACAKYGVKLGLYYSLWDRREPTHALPDPRPYVGFMKNQLTELLTGYGEIVELWFDGGWAKPDEQWHVSDVYAHIKALQPHCMVTINHTIGIPPGERVENGPPFRDPVDFKRGDPIRFWPVDFRTKDPNLARVQDPKVYTAPDGTQQYLPFEHTICLSDRWNWFQKRQVLPARPIDELEDLFYWCTLNDNVLLVNVPPDETGRLRANECEAILELADRLDIRGGTTPLPAAPADQALGARVQTDSELDERHRAANVVDGDLERSRWGAATTSASLTLTPRQAFAFDRIVINEFADMQDLGDIFSKLRTYRVRAFAIDGLQKGRWSTIHEGTTIGAARIARFDSPQHAEQLRIRILDATQPPSLHRVAVMMESPLRRRHLENDFVG